VLEPLAAERIRLHGRHGRLLDEVDIINAVSGGSMTAAYYALHGDRLFEDLDKRFFSRDLQDRLESRILTLAAIPRLVSPRASRSASASCSPTSTARSGPTSTCSTAASPTTSAFAR
jgi:NTE family protein